MFKARTSFLESAAHPFALSTFEDITERYIDFEGGIIAKQSSCFDPFLNTFTPTVILDERHVVLKINDAFQNNYGWKQENLRGKTLFDSNVVEVNDSLKSFIKTMNVKNFSKIYYGNIFTSKQQKFAVMFSCNWASINGNNYWILSIFDQFAANCEENSVIQKLNIRIADEVNKRRSLEIKNKVASQEFLSLVNGLPVGIYRSDYLGMFYSVNKLFVEMLGYSSRDELVMHNLRDIFTSDSQYASFHRSINTDNPQPMEMQLKRKDGSLIWVINQARQIIDADRIYRIEGILQDITENVAMRNAVKNTDSMYRNLFKNISDILISLDAKGNISALSPSFEQVTGFKTEEFIGKPLASILDTHPQNTTFLEIYTGESDGMSNQIIFIHKSKRYKVHSIVLNRQRNAQTNETSGYLGIARDVTDLMYFTESAEIMAKIWRNVHKEDSLLAYFEYIRELLSKIIDTSVFIIAMHEPELNTITFQHLKGNNNRFAFLDVNDKNSLTVKCITEGKPYFKKYTAKEQEESLQYSLIPIKIFLAVPLQVNDNTIGAMLFLSYEDDDRYQESDIDILMPIARRIAGAIELKQSQLEASNNRALLDKILDQVPVPIFFRDFRTHTMTILNEAYIRFQGKSRAELQNKSPKDIYTGPYKYIADFIEKIDGEIMKNGGYDRNESLLPSADGSMRNVIVQREVVFNSADQPTGIIGVMIDITEQRHTEEYISQALKKENELNKSISSFTSMVSHEYKTPLQSIALSVELLQNYYDKLSLEKRNELLNRISTSVAAMNSLVNEVLTLTKLNKKTLSFNPSMIDIRKSVNQLVEDAQFIAKKGTKIIFTANLSSDVVYIDDSLLRLIVKNLLSNANKYSPSGTIVNIDVKSVPELLHIEVKDRGIGIPKAEQSKLFQTFYRASNTGTTSGTGLGLAIVKEAVELMNGSISFTSKENFGTTFYVDFHLLKPKENSEKEEDK